MKRRAPMLLLLFAAALAGGAGSAAADGAEARVTPPRARLVEVFPRVRQALLFDKNRDEYVVVKRGDRFQGFRVSTLESDQIVLTSQGRPAAHYVLPLAPERRPAAPDGSSASSGELRILNPYAGSGEEDLDVVDPYSGREIPSVTAPAGSRAGGSSGGDRPDEPGGAGEPEPEPEPEPEEKAESRTGGQTEKKAREETRTVRRAELDEALADFHALRKEVEIQRTESGKIRITGLARGSFLHRLGLRKGDVVRSVAGRAIDNTDRAAAVYVELTVADRFDVRLDRGGSPLTIHYQVK